MLDEGMIETDVRRIGAEQEMILVDDRRQPAPVSIEVLDRLNDPHFTTELATYNMECNLDPLLFGRDCLRTEQDPLTHFGVERR